METQKDMLLTKRLADPRAVVNTRPGAASNVRLDDLQVSVIHRKGVFASFPYVQAIVSS